jgi:hypothetical protein
MEFPHQEFHTLYLYKQLQRPSLLFLGFADSVGIFNPAFTIAFMGLGARGLEQILVLQLLAGVVMIFVPRPLASQTVD